MPAKPNPLLGLVVGVVAGWICTTAVSYAGAKLNVIRMVRFDNRLSENLPWVLLVLVAAGLFGLLLSLRVIAAGALVGAGALLTIVGLGVQVLPLRQAFDLSRVFEVPGTNPRGYLAWDGSVLLVGVILLVLGVRRWAADAKQTPPQVQDGYRYQPGYPPQQQPAPWPSYPAQQPPGPPQGPPPGYPQHGQPPGYPQQPGGTFPG